MKQSNSSSSGPKTEMIWESSRALKLQRIVASDGMSCPIRSFSHRRQNSSRLARVTGRSEAKMTSFPF
jgi:hypothetical protein